MERADGRSLDGDQRDRLEEGRAKLLVRSISGESYVYVGVPGEVRRSFVDADSKGRYPQTEIRDRYPFNRLDA